MKWFFLLKNINMGGFLKKKYYKYYLQKEKIF
jgi:hypothetical protein